MAKKEFINHLGYGEDEDGLISRKVAYKEIYLKNRDKYPLPFGKYKVHHIDGEKLNNSVKNLYICIQADHNLIHEYQQRILRRFTCSADIDEFLLEVKETENKKIGDFQKKPTEIKKYYKYHFSRKERSWFSKNKKYIIGSIIILIIIFWKLILQILSGIILILFFIILLSSNKK